MVCLSVILVCYRIHAYDFVIKMGCYLCWTLYINSELDKKPNSHTAYILVRVE